MHRGVLHVGSVWITWKDNKQGRERLFRIIVPEAASSEESIQLVPSCIGAITALSGVTPMSPNEMEGPAVGNGASLSAV